MPDTELLVIFAAFGLLMMLAVISTQLASLLGRPNIVAVIMSQLNRIESELKKIRLRLNLDSAKAGFAEKNDG